MKPTPFVLAGLVVLLISSGSFALAVPTIDVLSQNYSATASVFWLDANNVPGNCFVTNSSTNSPVSAWCSSPVPPLVDAGATASGSVEPSGGFLGAGGGVVGGCCGTGEATATMDFLVTEPLVFSLHSRGYFPSPNPGSVSLINMTDDVELVVRGFGFNQPSDHFDNLSLEPSKQYRLRAWAQISGGTDVGAVRADFSVPELASFWLLLPALGVLCGGKKSRAYR